MGDNTYRFDGKFDDGSIPNLSLERAEIRSAFASAGVIGDAPGHHVIPTLVANDDSIQDLMKALDENKKYLHNSKITCNFCRIQQTARPSWVQPCILGVIWVE